MLDQRRSLLFPNIVFLRDVTVRSKRGVPLYRLDWTKVDAAKKAEREKWAAHFYPSIKDPYVPPLPERWEKLIQQATFAMRESYLDEIRRQSRTAVSEWSDNYPFDTLVRDHCLGAAIEHVDTAFYLLNDCSYDEKTHYYHRDGIEWWVLKSLLLWRFWWYQTGHGLLWDRAHLEPLEKSSAVHMNSDERRGVQEMLVDLKQQLDLPEALMRGHRPNLIIDKKETRARLRT